MDAVAPQAPSQSDADAAKAEPNPSAQDEEDSSAAGPSGKGKKNNDKELNKDGKAPAAASDTPRAGAVNDSDALEYPSVNLSFDAPSTGSATLFISSDICAGSFICDFAIAMPGI